MTLPGHARPRADIDVRVVRWSSIASLWLVVVVGGGVQLLVGTDGAPSSRTPVLVVLSVVAVVAATVTIPLLIRPAGEASVRHPAVQALVLTSLAVWIVSIVPPSRGSAWSFTLAIAGGTAACLLRGWGRVVLLAGTVVLLVVMTDADAPPGDLVLVGTLVLFTLMPLSVVWIHRVVLRLEAARRTASDLAVAEERLRFATDLHDIQGHHLQIIALKSELAERLVLAEPDRARAELGDIRSAARAALDDTRALVHDYRTVTVAAEVRNAASVLRSAGIDCSVQIVTTGMTDAIGALFAVAIREAATNTIRHSRATTAAIELRRVDDAWRLTVWNDAPITAGRRESGIAGLRQRIAPHSGTVETTRTDDRFTLVVRIPAGAESEVRP
ncbi:sensor histidine kinase [Curtobacterium sp. VKM Ac-2922]|uniref:sensor histidine kinase n=1 Tax=Curtobacterium sp. VKM Ac-2922 TaxID=2929475 RepID=UPI001FB44D7C|nr:histidine kinase [Curtobacterium sp. VKM Ac-2922]MCJ1712684.1 histidine kinase [Curtobacterium sp. VKM Ac-2922]